MSQRNAVAAITTEINKSVPEKPNGTVIFSHLPFSSNVGCSHIYQKWGCCWCKHWVEIPECKAAKHLQKCLPARRGKFENEVQNGRFLSSNMFVRSYNLAYYSDCVADIIQAGLVLGRKSHTFTKLVLQPGVETLRWRRRLGLISEQRCWQALLNLEFTRTSTEKGRFSQ